ncbi:hypothetical protein ABBQ32_009636 [Trebouxia sp. C0010 RCD-2024]
MQCLWPSLHNSRTQLQQQPLLSSLVRCQVLTPLCLTAIAHPLIHTQNRATTAGLRTTSVQQVKTQKPRDCTRDFALLKAQIHSKCRIQARQAGTLPILVKTCSRYLTLLIHGLLSPPQLSSATSALQASVADDKAEYSKSSQHIQANTHQAVPLASQRLHGLLMEAEDVTKRLTTASTKGYSDANKLVQMVEQVGAEREALRGDAATAQAVESRAKAAGDHLQSLTQQAQDLLTQLQQQAAVTEKQCQQCQQLQQQKEETHQVTAQAALISKQLVLDMKAAQEAAAASHAAFSSLAAQQQELLTIKQQLHDESQRAQQASRNLDVDVRAALEGVDRDTRSFQLAKQEAAAECSKLQAIMAAAKQQHQQHMTDMQSHLQEASEAAQHAQAAEAEVTQAAELLVTAAKADRAAATAAANQTEATLQRFKEALAAAEHTRALTTRQHTEGLKQFVLATVNDAVTTAICQATASRQDLSGTARQARGLLEGVSSEIADSMQAVGRSIEQRLMHAVQSAIAGASQSQATFASPGQPCPNQVPQRPSYGQAQGQVPPAADPSRPQSEWAQSMHTAAAQPMLALHVHPVGVLKKGVPPSQKLAPIPAGPADRTSSAARLQSALQQRQQSRP